jgi:2-polyprenyl-6-methoxyphenol hydroxylase-like FAD-dependent oxidoreductase
MNTGTTEIPVRIVGAGPAGLTAACALARLGVETLVVDRRAEMSSLPRATSVSTRSMELFRSWGLEDEIRAGGVDVEWQLWTCRTLAESAGGMAIPIGLPTREQSTMISPSSPACVPQDHLEPVLLRHLLNQGGKAELGVETIDVQLDEDGAVATLRDVATGVTRRVRARYVIAADGAHSRVRTALGIAMHGPDRLAEAGSAVFRAPLWELLGDHRYGIYDIAEPEAAGVMLPAGPGDRWLYGIVWQPGERDGAELTEDRFAELIRLAAGAPDVQPRIERTGLFTFAAQLAERFRQGNAFLSGDAAHRVTPRGGTGMNTAIQDGYDLGWKLGWVLNGWAGEALLDSYESERRPVAEHNVERSADPFGSRRNPQGEVHADLGGRIPHVRVPQEDGLVSTLDMLGPGYTVFTAAAGAPINDPSAGGAPVTVRRIDPVVARALGVPGGGALMVRPDGYPAREPGALAA